MEGLSRKERAKREALHAMVDRVVTDAPRLVRYEDRTYQISGSTMPESKWSIRVYELAKVVEVELVLDEGQPFVEIGSAKIAPDEEALEELLRRHLERPNLTQPQGKL